MQKKKFNLGGEQSGHIILGKFATTGDGVLVALEIIKSMNRKTKASDFFNVFKKIPQILENIKIKDDKILKNYSVKRSIKIAKKLIKNQCSFQSYGKKYNAIIDPEIKIKMVDISKIKKINNGYFVNSGAPHYVEFVDDLNKVDIIQEVTKIKSSEFYDNLPFNINFIQKENNLIYIRTFEKGVERETLSCGTGAVASSVVCSKIFEDNFPLIKARGGDLRVNYKKKRDLFYDITLSSNPLMEYNSYLKIISS